MSHRIFCVNTEPSADLLLSHFIQAFHQQTKLKKQIATIDSKTNAIVAQSKPFEDQQASLEDQQASLEDQQASLEDQQASLEDQQASLEDQIDTKQAVEWIGIAGPLSQAQGLTLLLDPKALSGTGLIEVISLIPKAYLAIRLIKSYLKQIDFLVLCDSPEINLRVIQEADRLKLPYLYLAPPQIWAWRAHRAKALVNAKAIACLFPFEYEFYQQQGLTQAYHIGHPLVGKIQAYYRDQGEFVQRFDQRLSHLQSAQQLVFAVFPGSRYSTVQAMLEPLLILITQLNQSPMLKKATPPRFQFAICSWLMDAPFQSMLQAFALKHQIEIKCCSSSEQALEQAHYAITHVGTACLEIALHGCPMVILSKLHPISYWMAEKMIQLPYVGLVNLLLGEKGFEEYHQPQKQYNAICRQIELDCQQLELKRRLFLALAKRVSTVNFSRIILELLKNLRHLSESTKENICLKKTNI